MENADMDVPAILPQPGSAEPGFSSSTGNGAASEQIPSQPVRKTPSVQSSGSATATPARKAAAPKPKPAETDRSAGAAAETESEIPTVEFLTAQISAPSPLTASSNLNIDKSAPPPMPDRIALSNSALERNPELTSQSQASGPAGSRNLVPSVLISQVSPVYPELAIRSRTSGTVVLELQIDDEGKVVKATPVSGPAVFYNEAIKAAMQYRYRPATLNGKNMSSKSRVTMVFNFNR
jgi:TonB family protein